MRVAASLVAAIAVIGCYVIAAVPPHGPHHGSVVSNNSHHSTTIAAAHGHPTAHGDDNHHHTSASIAKTSHHAVLTVLSGGSSHPTIASRDLKDHHTAHATTAEEHQIGHSTIERHHTVHSSVPSPHHTTTHADNKHHIAHHHHGHSTTTARPTSVHHTTTKVHKVHKRSEDGSHRLTGDTGVDGSGSHRLTGDTGMDGSGSHRLTGDTGIDGNRTSGSHGDVEPQRSIAAEGTHRPSRTIGNDAESQPQRSIVHDTDKPRPTISPKPPAEPSCVSCPTRLSVCNIDCMDGLRCVITPRTCGSCARPRCVAVDAETHTASPSVAVYIPAPSASTKPSDNGRDGDHPSHHLPSSDTNDGTGTVVDRNGCVICPMILIACDPLCEKSGKICDVTPQTCHKCGTFACVDRPTTVSRHSKNIPQPTGKRGDKEVV